MVVFFHQQLLPALLLGDAFRTQWFSKVPPSCLSSPTCSLAAYQDKWPFIGIGHLPHQKFSRLPRVGDVPLIIQQLLFKIVWELLAYRRPTPQRQPHLTHEPYGPSFTGFKTTSRNVQRSGLFLSPPCEVDYNSKNSPVLRLSRKNLKTALSISGNRPFLGPVNFFRDASHPLIAALCFRHSRTVLPSTPKIAAALRFPLSSAHQITSRLNCAICDSLLDFWRPSSITRVHDKLEQAVCLPVFIQLKL